MDGALVLYSGGLDSTTCLAFAKNTNHTPIDVVSFLYGQQHDDGLHHADVVLPTYGVRSHHVIDLPDIGAHSSSLVSACHFVPKGKDPRAPGIPNTYVPGRNLIFLSWAVSIAQESGLGHVYIGVNALDWSGYPDCRPEFIAAFERAARLGTGSDFQIHAPLVRWTKAEIIQWGHANGVDYAHTSTCYDPQESLACGTCDACQLRLEGFRQADLKDPIDYIPNHA